MTKKIGFSQAVSSDLNRQTRLPGDPAWQSHGNIGFFAALRDRAIAESQAHGLRKWLIETRCLSEPETIDTFEVQTTINAEILNPRKGA